jgi:hypothetical protein
MSAELAQLQRSFLTAIRDCAADAGAALSTKLAIGDINRSGIGLAIYQNAYAARLSEALANDHPLLGKYLGDALWQPLCQRFIQAHPSNVRSLRNFGDTLPVFLRANEPYAARAVIAELAQFERRLLDCFDSADAELATWKQLLATPGEHWASLHVCFHPSLQRHTVQWNSVEIWRALKAQLEPPTLHSEMKSWMLWRDAERITRFRALAMSEHAYEDLAYQHFQAGGDFAGLCELLQQTHDSAAVPAMALRLLQLWCNEGWVAGWVFPNSID